MSFPGEWSDDQVVGAYQKLKSSTASDGPSAADYLKQIAGSLIRGGAGVFASAPEQIAIGASALNRAAGGEFLGTTGEGNPQNPQDRALYQFGQSIRQGAENISPEEVPALKESFWASKVPQAFGSSLGFMAGGLVGRAAKIPAWAATAALGSAAGGVESYQDAKAHGADEDTALLASTVGSVVGTSEALPLAHIMKRLDGITGGTFSKAVLEAGKDTLEEAIQEGAQQLAQNFTAKQLYDKDRSLFEDVFPNAEAGGVTGFLVSAVTQALGAGIGRRNANIMRDRRTQWRRQVISNAVQSGELLPENQYAQGTRTQAPPIGQQAPELEQEAEGGLRLRNTPQNGLETQTGTVNETPPTPAPLAPQAPAIPANTTPTPTQPQQAPLAETTPQGAAPGVNGVGGPGVVNPPVQPARRGNIEGVVSDITSQWINPPPIRIVDRVDQLPPIPASLQQELASVSNPEGIRGLALDGVIYLVSDNLPTDDQVRRTLLHESVGHLGVGAVLDAADYEQFMRGVADRHADTELGRSIRNTYGDDPVVVGKEVVAKLAENPQADPSLWQRILATIRQWARAVFKVNVSDNDIRVLIARSAHAVQSGAVGGPASFSAQRRVPIQIKRADGTVIDGEFNGYYDLRGFGKDPVPSVGWLNQNGQMTHGVLNQGNQIIGQIPTFDEWQKSRGSFSISEPGTNPQVFRNREQVLAAQSNPGLSAEQQQIAEDSAKVQASMSPDNVVGWLMGTPTDAADAYAQRKLEYVEDRRHINPTTSPLSSMPSSTEDERRAKEVVGAAILAHYGIDRTVERGALNDIEKAQGEMAKAVTKVGKMTASQAKADVLSALFNKLVSGYKSYLVNLAKNAPASQNTQAEYRQALMEAERRLNEHEASPVAVQQALTQIAKNIPPSLLTGATNQAIIDWVVTSGILVGKVGDKTRLWMTVDDGTGNPALNNYDRIGQDLGTLRDIINNGDDIVAELKDFEKWFHPSGKEGKISARAFAEAYFKFRNSRDRAARVARAIEREIENLDTIIRGNLVVLDKLSQMMTNPEYVHTVREATDSAHIVVRAVYDTQHQQTGLIDRDKTVGRWRMRGPISGDEYVVDLYPSTAQEAGNRANLSAFVAEAREFSASHLSTNPLLADDYSKLADYIERFLLHPALDPATGFTQMPWMRIPGTQIRVNPDPFEWFSAGTGSLFKTIRDAAERIGGRVMRQVFSDAFDLDTTMKKVEAINANPVFGYQAQTAAILRAMASHGWSPELFGIWDEQIAEPVLAAGQNNLGPAYEKGDFVIGAGVQLTAEDVAALRLLKRWEDAILSVAPAHVKDKVGDLGVMRKAIGSGQFTMARLPAAWTSQFLQLWASAGTPAERENILSRDDYFRRVVLGYVGEFNPEFLAMNPASGTKSPLFKAYRKLALTEKQGVQRFTSLDQIVDFLATEAVDQGISPDYATAAPMVRSTLLAEIEKFIKRFEDNVVNAKSTVTFGGVPAPLVQTATANNAFTTPRGALEAPSTFYSYSTASDGRRMVHVGGLRSLMNLRIIQSAREAMSAMEAKKAEMEDRIQRLQASGKSQRAARSQIIKETAQDRKANLIRFDYLELLSALKLMAQAFGELERFESSTPSYYENAGINALNSTFGNVKTMLLSAPQAVTTNFFSGSLLGPALFHWQTGQFLKALQDVLPPIAGGTATATKTLLSRIAAMVDSNPELSAMLRKWKYRGFLANLASAVIDSAENWRRLQRIAHVTGMVTPYNFRATLRNQAALKRGAGRLMTPEQSNELSWPVVAVNRFFSTAGIRHFFEAFRATTPRAFDNLINYVMIAAFDRETEFLKTMGWKAFQAREELAGKTGADWKDLSNRDNILQPADLGLNSQKALNRYREVFMGLGSLDHVLLEFYERTKGMTPEQRAIQPLLSEDDHAATALQFAAMSNVATETNRPYGIKGKGSDGWWRNVVGTFMGWVSNMAKQFSKILQTHSGDSQGKRLTNNFLALTTAALLLAAIGAWNWDVGDWLTKHLFNVSPARLQLGNIHEPSTAFTYFAQALVNTVPLIGSFLGSMAGVAFTGRGNPFDMTSLIPQLNFVSSIYNTGRRMVQTGDAVLPLVDFARQWIPFSKVLMNRLPGIRGLVDQSNAIRSLNASAPPGTEIKWGQNRGGDVRYGPGNDEIQKLIAAAYEAVAHGGSPDLIRQRYQEAVEAFVKMGRSPQDAVKGVATALAAKEPIRILTGREFTPAEEAQWVARMTPEQRKDYDTAVEAWRALSNVTGKDLNMTSTQSVSAGGGGGHLAGMTAGISGGAIGGKSRRISAPRLTAMSSSGTARLPRISAPKSRTRRGKKIRGVKASRMRSPSIGRIRSSRSSGSSGGHRSSILRHSSLR